MVDRQARARYAEILRHFASGRMTNREYEKVTEDSAFDSEDPALREVWTAIWGLYDDMHEHRMTGRHHLTGGTRQAVAQCILFLQSDQEYGWPSDRGFCMAHFLLGVGCLAGVCSAAALSLYGALLVPGSALGWWISRHLQRRRNQLVGDDQAWPFLSMADLAEARRHPYLLAGSR